MEESPELDRFYRESSEVANLLVVAVQDTEEDVTDFLQSNGYQFPVMLDLDGQLAMDYRVQGVPTLVVIDSQGEISRTLVGVKPTAEDLVTLAQEAG